MKKILLIVICALFLIPKVWAGANDSYVDWDIHDLTAYRTINGNVSESKLAFIKIDGKVGYCIEPGIKADKGSYYNSTYNINETNLAWANENELELIGYYGYGRFNHNDIKYYAATQELLWRKTGAEDVYWKDIYGNVVNIDFYKNEILKLISNHEKTPNFIFNEDYIVGDNISVIDINNVLSEFELSGTNINIKLDNNTINIKIDENNNFVLRRKKTDEITKYYYKNTFQTIATFGYPYEVKKEYNVSSLYGHITFNRLDSVLRNNTPINSQSTLKGAVYGLYDIYNNLLKEAFTDNNGVVSFNNLVKGTYRIREIKPSMGYINNDKMTYGTTLSSLSKKAVINSYNVAIKKKVDVLMVYDDKANGIMVPLINKELYLYGNDTLIKTINTNDEGIASIELYYGNYVLKSDYGNKNIEVLDNQDSKVVIVAPYISKEEPVLLLEEQIDNVKEEEYEEELPNTNIAFNINYIYYFILIILGCIYEKKYM